MFVRCDVLHCVYGNPDSQKCRNLDSVCFPDTILVHWTVTCQPYPFHIVKRAPGIDLMVR